MPIDMWYYPNQMTNMIGLQLMFMTFHMIQMGILCFCSIIMGNGFAKVQSISNR